MEMSKAPSVDNSQKYLQSQRLLFTEKRFLSY
jgi:hypothetical protein